MCPLQPNRSLGYQIETGQSAAYWAVLFEAGGHTLPHRFFEKAIVQRSEIHRLMAEMGQTPKSPTWSLCQLLPAADMPAHEFTCEKCDWSTVDIQCCQICGRNAAPQRAALSLPKVPHDGETQSSVVIGASRHGEKAVDQTEGMEQRHCAWAKGRLHPQSGEANSTSARAPGRRWTQRPGPLLGSYRHHAARTGTTRSNLDCCVRQKAHGLYFP